MGQHPHATPNKGSLGAHRQQDLPIRVIDVDVAQPIPPLSLFCSASEQPAAGVLALVRLHTYPLGLLPLLPSSDRLTGTEVALEIWRSFAAPITAHLQEDGAAAGSILDGARLREADSAPCLRQRTEFLAEAPFVSVVVATRDRPEQLSACLDALCRLAYPRYEVIVVDNAPSTTATVEMLHRRGTTMAPIRYVREPLAGTSRARNRGLAVAQGEIVAFTDDDAVPDRHWLAELVRGFTAGPRVACVTGLILPAELVTPAQLWFEQFGGFGRGFQQRVYDLARNRPPDPLFPYTAGRFGSGPSMAFRRSVLRDLGGFDPALGGGSPAPGGEDLAAFFQIISHGFQLVYQPAAIVFHTHRREFSALRRQLFAYGLGVTAFLTKCVLDEPCRLPGLLARLPPGARHALSPRSQKNRWKQSDYPRELGRLEVLGMLCGPFAYLRGRWLLPRRTGIVRRRVRIAEWPGTLGDPPERWQAAGPRGPMC